MTQIKNPENGNQKGTVTIVGYSERFFMNAAPPVHIMKGLLEIGEVEKNGKIKLDIDKESRIVFKCNQCSCRFSPIVVKPGDWVVLIYEQAMDCIVPVVTDSEHYLQAKLIYRETQKQMIMQMKTREAQRQKMIREAQRPAEIRALKRAGIYSLVVIALGAVAAIGINIYNVIEQNKRSRSTDFSYVGNNTSVEGQSANYEAPKTIEDYDDNSTRQYNSSNTNQSITKTVFRHESDVHKYLRNHEFTDANGDITISESYNMSLKFNGRELTGAIAITEFNSCAAYFTAHSPISGLTYQFIVNCEQGVLYCVSDGTTYYAR